MLKKLLALLFILTITTAFTQDRALWIWKTDEAISSENEINKVINQCIDDNVTDIYIFADNRLSGLKKINMQTFISKATCNNIQVWALEGNRKFFSDWEGPLDFHAFIEDVKNYNATSLPEERFIGVQSDNEPQDGQGEPLKSFHSEISDSNLSTTNGSGLWQSTEKLDREMLMRDWLTITKKAYNDCHASNLLFGAAMPSWLDRYYGEAVFCTFDGSRKRVLEHMMKYVDDYCIMSYNTDPVNAFNRIKGELEYAETLPVNSRPRVWGGIETECGVGQTISYCDTQGKDEKAIVLSDLAAIDVSGSQFSAYQGMAIHNWRGWKNLAPISSDISSVSCNQYTLTTIANPSSFGSVTPGGTFNQGEVVTITATPNNGKQFDDWNDGTTTATRTITMNSDITVTANFSVISVSQFTLTTLANPSSFGSVTPGGTFNQGEVVTITATPNNGNQFDDWNDGTTTATRTITMNSNVSLTANFSIISNTGYCASTSNGSTGKNYITKVIARGNSSLHVNKISNVSSSSISDKYTDYTSMVVDFVANKYQAMYIFQGWQASSSRNGRIAVWIDLNQDNIFSDNEIVLDQAAKGFNYKGISIPATAKKGTTRMRVIIKKGTTTPNPCGTFADGEVEDYTVNIVGDGSSTGEGHLTEKEVKLYPNPTTGLVRIELALTNEKAIYKLSSINGQILFTGEFISATNYLDLKDLTNGVYFLQFLNNKRDVIKIIKN